VKQRDCRFGAARPRLGFASELMHAVKIIVAFQNALLEVGLILFVVLIVGGMSYLVR
jgi:hypothetical protein